MRKRRIAALATIIISVSLLMPLTVSAKTPSIMSSLRSYIKTYGSLKYSTKAGSDSYSSKITYQKKKKRFLFECTYTNGKSVSYVKMYMPVAKKKASYTVYFKETVRAKGKTAKISGKATLKRKTYNNLKTYLKFSRKNGTAVSKKITTKAYRNAANSLLRYAVTSWEYMLESNPTLSLRNFGFNKVTVLDGSIYAKEWK